MNNFLSSLLKYSQPFFICIFSVICAKTWQEQNYADLTAAVGLSQEQAALLAVPLQQEKDERPTVPVIEGTCELFQMFPDLACQISYICLADLPTPVQQITDIESVQSLYIKRDDLTVQNTIQDQQIVFGGNKVRKLEFLLADAVAKGAQAVMTFGCAGSNHATATATHAKRLGLDCFLILMPQKNSHTVQRNLLVDHAAGAQLVFAQNRELRKLHTLHHFFNYRVEHNAYPYVIPTGGSCPIGVLGYVNAVFELKKQIADGLLPEPDYIYLPIGSGGTTAGLLLGIKAAGLKSKIVAVSVVPNAQDTFARKVAELFAQTNMLLCAADASFPLCTYCDEDLEIRTGFEGVGYAIFTQKGMDAKKAAQQVAHITLDGVYSAKAAAALLDDLKQRRLEDKNVLFWDTFCADDFEMQIQDIDYKELPTPFHNYFERPVQELDC